MEHGIVQLLGVEVLGAIDVRDRHPYEAVIAGEQELVDAIWAYSVLHGSTPAKYQAWLIKHLEDNPSFIQPDRYRNEVLGFLREPLQEAGGRGVAERVRQRLGQQLLDDHFRLLVRAFAKVMMPDAPLPQITPLFTG